MLWTEELDLFSLFQHGPEIQQYKPPSSSRHSPETRIYPLFITHRVLNTTGCTAPEYPIYLRSFTLLPSSQRGASGSKLYLATSLHLQKAYQFTPPSSSFAPTLFLQNQPASRRTKPRLRISTHQCISWFLCSVNLVPSFCTGLQASLGNNKVNYCH